MYVLQSFTGVGGQQSSVAWMSRRKSGSQVRVISLSRGGSSLSVTSTNSNSSTHSGNSNHSHHSLRSAGAYQTDSPERPFVAVSSFLYKFLTFLISLSSFIKLAMISLTSNTIMHVLNWLLITAMAY